MWLFRKLITFTKMRSIIAPNVMTLAEYLQLHSPANSSVKFTRISTPTRLPASSNSLYGCLAVFSFLSSLGPTVLPQKLSGPLPLVATVLKQQFKKVSYQESKCFRSIQLRLIIHRLANFPQRHLLRMTGKNRANHI